MTALPLRLTATPAAEAVIEHLREVHGDITFHVSGGHRISLTCLPANELRLGPRDRSGGEICGVPFYLMTDEPEEWRNASVSIGIGSSLPGGFSLEAPLGVCFTIQRRRYGDMHALFANELAGQRPRRKWSPKW